MSVLNNAVKHATDGFIGILDMFGFEDPKVFNEFIILIRLLKRSWIYLKDLQVL